MNVSRETERGIEKMIIHIFKSCKCVRTINVDKEAALPLFNLILQALESDEEVILYADESEERIVASACC